MAEEKGGFFSRLFSGLSKSREGFADNVDNVFLGYERINDDLFDELEEVLIMGDLGMNTTEEILDELRDVVKKERIKSPGVLKVKLIEILERLIAVDESAYDFLNGKAVIMVVGVNGVGKTTTIGKLAQQFKDNGKKVIIAAADTFRAAAREQLEVWAERAGVDIIGSEEGSDPSSVIFDAISAMKSRGGDILLIDTAGRLHNKKNLMNELSKMNRVIDRECEGYNRETFVVLDATTGQNAIMQAREFASVTDITGIVLTKMDGTAKGGIAFSVSKELECPVKYIGVGETAQDLQKFDPSEFSKALFGEVKAESETSDSENDV
jgi:fused signal recognition particle receptor